MQIMTKIITVLYIILFAVTAAPLYANERQSAVIIMYHHFGDNRYPSTNIRIEQFEAHLNFLESQQFNVWPLDKIITQIRNGQSLPDKTIAITIDDAYRTVYSNAYPMLKQRGWPFTVFVSTDYIDKKFSNYMNWEQIREMAADGASFANHSASHRHLIRHDAAESDNEWQTRIRQDVLKAQQRLEQEVKTTIPYFAYPYGEYNSALTKLVTALGLVGLGQHSGAIGPNSDFSSLPRFPINEAYADMPGFSSKVLSLAMPISATKLPDPQTSDVRPLLNLTLKPSDMQVDQLNCYVSDQGRVDINWLNDEKTRFNVQAKNDLPAGRSRYNCTAPSKKDGQHFYWFSQPWIRPSGVKTLPAPK